MRFVICKMREGVEVMAKLTNVQVHFKQCLKNPKFKKLWDETKDVSALASMVISARCKEHLTQAQFAKKYRMNLKTLKIIEEMDFEIIPKEW